MKTDIKVKPINIWKSIILFGIPGLLLYLGLIYGIPYFQQLGFKDVFLFPFFLWLPLIPLLPVSILLFRKEKKNNPTLKLADRFRLKRITKNDWLWIIAGVLTVFFFDFVIMEPISKWFASKPLFSPPDHFPIFFNPLKEVDFPISTILGVPLHGNWLFLIVTIILHTIAMIAEEFLWRGYILPRQEVKYGKHAWLVNGLLWGYLVHFFMKWNFISFLPSMLITPFIAQRTKNTWVSLMIHGIPNTILWIIILTGILGIG
ncbi:MAG: CPBP family intramembrane metalloprotease [Ignavibacteria bacterium]|nr:CPBP family intramembrane metalloprotease [Ignavibacteria bacterium]